MSAVLADTRQRWGLCFAVIFVLHAVAFWLAIQLHRSEAPPLPVPAVVMISLPPLHAPPPPPPRPKQQVAQKPPQPMVQPNVPRSPARHVDVPIPPKLTVKTPERSAPAEQAKPATNDQPPAPATAVVPQVDAPPAPAVPARAPGAVAPSNAVPNWQGLVLGRLEQFKRYPRAAQFRRQQGVVYLRFSMDRHGKVVSAAIDQSSGVDALDQETLALVHRAEPLPPPPPEVSGDPVELVVPIQFFLKS